MVTLKYIGPPGRVKSLNWSYVKCTFDENNTAQVEEKAADRLIKECPADFVKVPGIIVTRTMTVSGNPPKLIHKQKEYKTFQGATMAILRSKKYSKETHKVAELVNGSFVIAEKS